MVINSFNLIKIRYKSYQEGAFYYGDIKGTITTDYQRKQLKEHKDVYALLKDSFKNLLQGLLKAELDISLGYDLNERYSSISLRNGMSVVIPVGYWPIVN